MELGGQFDAHKANLRLAKAGASPRMIEADDQSSFHVALVAPKDLTAHHTDAWRDLQDNCAEPNVFFEHGFLLSALVHCDRDQSAKIAMLWDHTGKTLIGLMPFARENGYGRWPVAYMRNWLHPNCFLGTPLVRVGCERGFWQAFLDHLDSRPEGLFLHLEALRLDGPVFAALRQICAHDRRRCDTVRSERRALMHSPLHGSAYFEATVRKKKRKELVRLRSRLEELGRLETVTGIGEHSLDTWLEEFLALEASSWKGRNLSALASQADTRALFIETVKAAHARERIDLSALRLDGRPIAMLVSFISPPGGFSFKTAFDETLARYSPGVLLQIDMLDLAARHGLEWVDSCAAPDHPMIESLWGERRTIGRISITLKRRGRPALFALLRQGETAIEKLRNRRHRAAVTVQAEEETP